MQISGIIDVAERRRLNDARDAHPFWFWVGANEHQVQYLPAESKTGMFDGNSNWRDDQ